LADSADVITSDRFKALDLRVEAKPDATPVTDADIAVEDMIRDMLSRARPRDAVHGEERPDTGFGPRRWVIDPIDGTKNYLRGVPVWATLIALMDGNEVVVGVVSAPALNRRWWAHKGGGAFAGRTLLTGAPCRVSAVAALEDASLSYSSVGGWVECGLGQQFANLLRDCWRTRAFGDFWSYMLLAEGAVDMAAEPELELHDMAAASLIVAEAGGAFTSLTGRPGPFGPGAVATNGLLQEELLGRLSQNR
jgi:histidinol-phosphatase